MSLLHPTRPDSPHLEALRPLAALPGGAFEVFGTRLTRGLASPELPHAFFGEIEGALDLLRPTRAQVRVPEGAIASDLSLRYLDQASNALHANVAVPVAEDLHMISNPAVDADGNLFAMVSGPRGTKVSV